jgi:hypothetical protein
MAYQLSDGLRNKILDTGSYSSIFNLCFIKIYGGGVPASANAAESATLLCTVSNNSTGTGLTWDPAAGGTISKKSSEVWSGLCSAGTATHFRLVAAGDTGALSTTQARVQGLVGTVGSDMNLASVALTGGATQNIDTYNWTLPTF